MSENIVPASLAIPSYFHLLMIQVTGNEIRIIYPIIVSLPELAFMSFA